MGWGCSRPDPCGLLSPVGGYYTSLGHGGQGHPVGGGGVGESGTEVSLHTDEQGDGGGWRGAGTALYTRLLIGNIGRPCCNLEGSIFLHILQPFFFLCVCCIQEGVEVGEA